MPGDRPLRCLIVDDEPPAREGLRKLLRAHAEVEVVGEAPGVNDALRLATTHRPELVFLDVQLRGESGFDFLARAPKPPPLIIFITAHDRHAAAAFGVEAVDYLLKPVAPKRLADALRRARRRADAFALPSGVSPNFAALQSLGLTPREAEVLFWVVQGKSNPEIACILENSPGTVKKQVQSILEKLDVESRVTAALMAAEILGIPRA